MAEPHHGERERSSEQRRERPRDPLAVLPLRDDDGRRTDGRTALGDRAKLRGDVVRALPSLVGVLREAGLHETVESGRRHPLDRGSDERIAAMSEAWLVPLNAFRPVDIS